MTNIKATKKALLCSVAAIAICIVMLMGTTFAWFTDSASTAVNRIQSGSLKLALVDENGEDLTKRAIKWVAKDGREQNKILWEPGASYTTEKFYIKNTGNLALKYKVNINGFTGDKKLLEVLDFSFRLTGDTVDNKTQVIEGLDSFNAYEGHLLPQSERMTTDTQTTEPDIVGIEIIAKMHDSADNGYQGLSLDGIGVTVLAAQYTYEKDSKDENYDINAEYPLSVNEIENEYGNDGMRMPAGVEIVNNTDGTFDITLNDEESFIYFTQVFDREAAFNARKAAWDAGEITRYPYEYNISSLNMWYGPYCSRITVKMNCDVDLLGRYVKPFGFGGYEFDFDGNGHTIKNAKITASSGNAGFFVSRVNVSNLTLDNINVTATGCDSAGIVAGSPNSFIKNVTIKNSSVTGGKYTGAVAGYDYGDITDCKVTNTVVTGQYKTGGIVGYVCTDNASQHRNITGNKLSRVTVKGENIWPGKEKNGFVIGKIVGNWNAANGTCNNNTFSGTTTATEDIGEIENGCTVVQ